jgi:hypothetical protein
MEIPQIVWMIGGVGLFVLLALLGLFIIRSRQVDLTQSSSDEKPDWLRSMPPERTDAIPKGNELFNHKNGEQVASPFVEQIEDILLAMMQADPELAQMEVDLGTSADGGLEIWVNGESYTDINQVPNEKFRQVFQQAVKQWDQA